MVEDFISVGRRSRAPIFKADMGDVVYKPTAVDHDALKNGFDLCPDAKDYLTKQQWGDIGLLAAATVLPCTIRMLDRLKEELEGQQLIENEARVAIGKIGGEALQLNVTFTDWLLSQFQHVAKPRCARLSRTLEKELGVQNLDFAELVHRVEGYKEQLSPHLRRVASDTLTKFELDTDLKLLVQTKAVMQPPHTDNVVPGSLYNVILFGCGANGELYEGDVPCTHVCRYENMANITKYGRGWPLDWRHCPASTPPMCPGFASIVSPANNIHWGVGRSNDFALRCSLFRMARHPECKKFFDSKVEGGDLQMFEYSYLWQLGHDELFCESVTHHQNIHWRTSQLKEEVVEMETALRQWQKGKRTEEK